MQYTLTIRDDVPITEVRAALIGFAYGYGTHTLNSDGDIILWSGDSTYCGTATPVRRDENDALHRDIPTVDEAWATYKAWDQDGGFTARDRDLFAAGYEKPAQKLREARATLKQVAVLAVGADCVDTADNIVKEIGILVPPYLGDEDARETEGI